MKFAFSLSTFSETDVSHDQFADYGSINAYYEYWDGDGNNYNVPIKSRPCTAADFGLDPENELDSRDFHNVKPNKLKEFKRKLNALWCVDEPITLFGNWNTETA